MDVFVWGSECRCGRGDVDDGASLTAPVRGHELDGSASAEDDGQQVDLDHLAYHLLRRVGEVVDVAGQPGVVDQSGDWPECGRLPEQVFDVGFLRNVSLNWQAAATRLCCRGADTLG
jgi:hypothetical protein